MEERSLPAVTATLSGGTLSLIGTDSNDAIRIIVASSKVSVVGANIKIGSSYYSNTALSSVTRISVEGRGGNDSIDLRSGNISGQSYHTIPTTVYGGLGNDTIYGGNGNDVFYGESGNDYMVGAYGNDTIDGGYGNDSIYGSEGNDYQIGGYDNDRLDSWTGNDTADGGQGDDSVYGGEGNDSLVGAIGNDSLYGYNGNDTLSGGDGVDLENGDAGNDFLRGDGSNDSIYGGEGNDSMYGGDGNDRIDSWLGNDLASAENGNDTVYGGEGNDSLYGGTGNDMLSAWYGNDLLSGNDNNDTLYGSTGNDSLYGGNGNDYLEGWTGSDYQSGGSGEDSFHRFLTYTNGLALGAPPADEEIVPADEPAMVTGAFLYDNQESGVDSWADVKQQASPTCSFLASLAGNADWTDSANDMVKAITYNSSSDTYNVKLYVNGAWRTYSVNAVWNEAWDPEGPIWVTLYQKAYLKANNVVHRYSSGAYMPASSWYSSTNADWQTASLALQQLNGYTPSYTSYSNASAATMQQQVRGTSILVTGSDDTNIGSPYVIADHAYWIMDVYQSGSTWYVQLYNPWGIDNTSAMPNYGSDDGIIYLTFETWKNDFDGYSRN